MQIYAASAVLKLGEGSGSSVFLFLLKAEKTVRLIKSCVDEVLDLQRPFGHLYDMLCLRLHSEHNFSLCALHIHHR